MGIRIKKAYDNGDKVMLSELVKELEELALEAEKLYSKEKALKILTKFNYCSTILLKPQRT